MTTAKITKQMQHELVIGYRDLKRNADGSYSGTYRDTRFLVSKETAPGWSHRCAHERRALASVLRPTLAICAGR